MSKPFFYGVIEGFYGQQWDWHDRFELPRFLEAWGHDCYIYAPKGDAYFRKRWREPLPEQLANQLATLSQTYHDTELRWGLAISPWGLQESYSAEDRRALMLKVDEINQLQPDIIAVLFDDMPGAVADLAARQAEIVNDIALRSGVGNVWMCPTYYSFDPALEQLFGAMPDNYLQDLAKRLPKHTEVMWTGNRVINPHYTEDDFTSVTELLGRRPLLWDNYPVNDGRRTANFLHLNAFTGRPGALNQWVSGHLSNPMNQFQLSKIPLASLFDLYLEQDDYTAETSWEHLADELLPAALAELLRRDRALFQEQGLAAIDDAKKLELIAEYSQLQHPGAREIELWLNGKYRFDPECLND